jgi:hypothetical protein
MKKLYAAMIVLALSLAVNATAMAQGRMCVNGAKKAGCSSCQTACATPERMRKFKAESLDLRQEMMTKRFELQREDLKETPDSAKVAAIKADMDAIKVKLDALKTTSKIPVSASCRLAECQMMDSNRDQCCGKKGCGKHDPMVCSSCNTSADCGWMNCNKRGTFARCAQAGDCGCSKSMRGARK